MWCRSPCACSCGSSQPSSRRPAPPPPCRTPAGRRAPPRRPARCSAPAGSGTPGAGGSPTGSSQGPPPCPPACTLVLGLKHHSRRSCSSGLPVQPGTLRVMAVAWMRVAASVLRMTPALRTQQAFTCNGSQHAGRRHSVALCGWHSDACPAQTASEATKPWEKPLRAAPPFMTLLHHPSTARPGLLDALKAEGSATRCSVRRAGQLQGWDEPSVHARGGPRGCWGRQEWQKQYKALTSRMFSLLSLSTRREPETRSCLGKR